MGVLYFIAISFVAAVLPAIIPGFLAKNRGRSFLQHYGISLGLITLVCSLSMLADATTGVLVLATAIPYTGHIVFITKFLKKKLVTYRRVTQD